MIYIGSSQAIGISLNTNIISGYVGTSLFWPIEVQYTLRDVVVHYSSGDSLLPSCANYAWLTGTLVATQGDIVNQYTVELNPSIVTANDLYVISYSGSLGRYIIQANTTKKTTEYEYQYTRFTGTYTVGSTVISPTLGVTSTSVILQANAKTVTPAVETTTSVYAYLTNQSFTYETDIAIDAFGDNCYADVTCTQYYNLTHEKTTYTSGVSVGGDTSTGLSRTNVVPTAIRVTPTTGTSITNNRITFGNNQSLDARNYYVYATIGGVESQNTCQIEQGGNVYMYGEITVLIEYETIDASGGTVTPYVTYSQTRGFAPNTSGQGSVSSGGSITYYVNNSYSSNGAVSANSLGSTPHSSLTQVASNCYATVSMNGKTGTSEKVSVYQEINEIINTTAVVDIYIGGVKQSSYTVGPQDATYSFEAFSTRTHTWSSRATSTETVGKTNLTATKTGVWFSLSNWTFTTNENTSSSTKSGSITVKDGTTASATLSLTQQAVIYEFALNTPPTTSIGIGYNDTAFYISVVSTRNYKPYAISSSNIAFSSNTMSGLTKSVSQSVLDPTIYTATFGCNTNGNTSTRGVTITFTQPTSRNTLTYNVTQAAYVPATITTSADYVVVNTTGGSYADFTITTNKNWSIETNFALCDFNGDSLGYDMAACQVSRSSGSAGTTTVRVTRGSYTANSIIDIKITSDNVTKHVIVVPQFYINNVITTWSPDYNSHSTQAITYNYPSVTWSGTNAWLTASGDTISVAPYNGSSNRTGTLQASGSFSGTFFGVSYSTSSTSSSISVTQTAAPQVTYIYIIGDKRYHEVYLSTSNNSVPTLITLPKAVYVNGISVYGEHGQQPHTGGYAVIQAGRSWETVSFDDQPLDDDEEIDVVLQNGNVTWGGDGTAPTGYAFGHNQVIWI